jgi:hypothetical protein
MKKVYETLYKGDFKHVYIDDDIYMKCLGILDTLHSILKIVKDRSKENGDDIQKV